MISNEDDLVMVIPLQTQYKFQVSATHKGEEIILHRGNDADASFEAFERAHKRYQALCWSINHDA
jgi:capsid protein